MLKLVNITKDYVVADTKVRALKGLNLCFRKNEFVSILGPSGCGKTTLLNIIGGLDHCTSGDLTIYGRSTKEYDDRDWDVYRNHRIGFIFQSYNLIPHQTVLGNVELALTIAGMSKAERVEKAKAALDKVGLSDQYYKKPNQLSGGQCQRVAIARSLVNDPEILLADEPTGALDTTTSVQIMELIKEIAKERLVIMVTHNPELAEQYSTRIIKLLDGNLVDDRNPFSEADEKKESDRYLQQKQAQEKAVADEAVASGKKIKKKEKAKMSFWTAFKLSLQNLFTKKRRTAMTAIAGSIGIIGVSLVLSISFGIQGFISNMQNEMLAGFPITVSQTTIDMQAVFSGMSFGDKKEIVETGDWVSVEPMIKELSEQYASIEDFFVTNTINKKYVTYLNDMPQENWAALYYDYGINIENNLYANFRDPAHKNGRQISLGGIRSTYGSVLAQVEGFEQFSSLIGMMNTPFIQAPDTRNPVTKEYVESQYKVIATDGNSDGIAKEAGEVMIVLSEDRMLTDIMLGQLGYYSQDEFINIVYRTIEDKKIATGEMTGYDKYNAALDDGGIIQYEQLLGMEFTWYPNNSVFKETLTKLNSEGIGEAFEYFPYADSSFKGGKPLKIVGILQPKEGLSSEMLSSGFYYTTALAEEIVQENWKSDIAKYLRGELAGYEDAEKAEGLSGSAMVFRQGAPNPMYNPDSPNNPANPQFLPSDFIMPLSGQIVTFTYDYTFLDTGKTETPAKGLVGGGTDMMGMMISMLMGTGGGNSPTMVSLTMTHLGGNVEADIEKEDDGTITKWQVTLDDGKAFAIPAEISIYPPDFTAKDNVVAYLDAWNDENPDNKIVYSDTLSMIINMISSLINMITIALVGFTSLALLVSCVMIGIITYVSVVERIKEIGVIRSLGGRKRDVSNLFTAETFIIGLTSGIIGILVTYLLSFILNLAVGAVGIAAIASFPWWVALIMTGVSVGLTLISGLMPSRSAAKKDPVVALRTE